MEKLEEVTSKWYELGLELRLSLKELDDIKSKPKRVPEQEKFKDMLTYWIQHGKPNTRTWGFLATAVEKSGNRALAERIKKRGDYKQGEEGIYLLCVYVLPQSRTLSGSRTGCPIREQDKYVSI